MIFQQQSINTDGLRIYGDNACIDFMYWNGCVSVKMAPIKPEDERTPNSVFDYKNRLQLAIPFDSAIILGNRIIEEIIPALEAGEEKSVGVISSKVNLLMVKNTKTKDGKIVPVIWMYLNIDETHHPEKMLGFVFRPKRIFTKFEPETGDFDLVETTIDELKVVANFLKSIVNMYGQPSHDYKIHNYNQIANTEALKGAIASKLGIMYESGQVNYVRRNQADPWITHSQSSEKQEPAAPVTSVASADDIANLL